MNSKSRLLVLLLLVVAVGLVATGARNACRDRSEIAAGTHGVRDAIQSTREESRAVRAALRSVAAIARSGAASVEAQEVLDFKPVPAESLSEFEQRRARNAARRASGTAPAVPEPPAEPEITDISEPVPPAEPIAPSAPGKSGNITRLGSDIEIEADQVVVGDVVALGGDVTIAGHVEGDVAAMGGDVFLKSTARIDGDVVCMGGRLSEEDGAKVGGQRVSGLAARRHPLVIDNGKIPVDDGESVPRRHRDRRGKDASGSIVWLLIVLGLAWAFTRLGPGRTTAAVATLRAAPGLSLGVGALIFALIIPSIVALALVVAILCITIIGIPFALAALLAYFLFLALIWCWGFVVAAVVIGEIVLGRLASSSAVPPGGIVVEKPAPTLTRKALAGALVLGGADVVGEIMQLGPLHGLGTFISVVAFITGVVALTFGAGAWMRTEIKAGTLARWWRGNQWGRNTPAPAPAGGAVPFAPAPYVPPAPPSHMPPSPPPPSPPSSFAPPNDPGAPPPSAPVG